jgi:hypothetical protein
MYKYVCPHTGLSASNHLVLLEDLTDLLRLAVREHKADVELDRVAKLEERGLCGSRATENVLKKREKRESALMYTTHLDSQRVCMITCRG